jgi:hypothetical protein
MTFTIRLDVTVQHARAGDVHRINVRLVWSIN